MKAEFHNWIGYILMIMGVSVLAIILFSNGSVIDVGRAVSENREQIESVRSQLDRIDELHSVLIRTERKLDDVAAKYDDCRRDLAQCQQKSTSP